MMHHRVTIYALIDPRTGGVRYVGQTIKPLSSRLVGHMREAQQQPASSLKTHWIAELVSYSLKPFIRPLCVVERCDADRVETVLIDRWDALLGLVNVRKRGYAPSFETCANDVWVARQEYRCRHFFSAFQLKFADFYHTFFTANNHCVTVFLHDSR